MKITLDFGNGFRLEIDAENRIKVTPDNQTIAAFRHLVSLVEGINERTIAMSETGQQIIDKLTSAEAKLADVDARTDAVQQMVGDLRTQIAGLATISDAEKAAINASLDRITTKLGTEAQQLDDTLSPPAPTPAP